jgi:hypothetical protein
LATAAKDDLEPADGAAAEGRLPGAGREIEPGYILDSAALFAHEVVVALEAGVEPRSPALGDHFPHQPAARQIAQVVIDSGARRQRIGAVDGAEDLLGRGMNGAAGQVLEHGEALCRGPKGGAAEGFPKLG